MWGVTSFLGLLSLTVAAASSCAQVNPLNLRWRKRALEVMERSPLRNDPNVGTFTQRQDHFDPTSTATWEQRFKLVTDHFSGNGPIFLFLSGEAPMEFFEFQEVQIYNWAARFGAAYAVIEHRGYGDSWPAADASVENMQYISSRQALADAAEFLPWIRAKAGVSPDAKAVVFGCSYSGALSAWFRLLYPQLVVASVAPSGPVEAQLDFSGFFEQFPASAGSKCAADAATASAAVSDLISSGQTRTLCAAFNCCEGDIAAGDDLTYFALTYTGTIGSADQMSNPPTFSLNRTCDILGNQTAGGLDRAVAAFNYVNAHPDDLSLPVPSSSSSSSSAAPCNSFSFSAMIKSLQGTTTKGNADGGRSWYWQKCTEFGFFKGYQGSLFPNVPYTFPLSFCEKIFGIPGMSPDIDGTNEYYGAKGLNSTATMFTNGLLDPWHLLSITEGNGHGVSAVTYEAGHCAPLIHEAFNDPPSLHAARQQVIAFLSSVLEV